MRRTHPSLVCAAILSVTACQQEILPEDASDGLQGSVEISLTAESRATALTKASADIDSDLPDVEDFTVEILSSDASESLYKNSYSKLLGKTIYLNTGDYTLLAYHGDSLAAGFDAAYFAGTQPFTIEQQRETEVELTARLANVAVKVNYGTNLVRDYDNFYALLRARKNADMEVRYEQDETRPAYLPSGNLTLELYADIDGAWLYCPCDAGDFSPNDFVTLNVDTESTVGSLTVTVTVDDGTDLVEQDITAPCTVLPKDAPTLEFSGLDEDGAATVTEAMQPLTDPRADIVAYGEISSLRLDIESDYLASKGVPETVDLATIDSSTAELLKNEGLRWSNTIAGRTLAYIDFTGLLETFSEEYYLPDDPITARITLTVADALGQSSESRTLTLGNAPAQFSFTVEDYDVWAHRIANPSVALTDANPAEFTLQYQAEGETEWHDAVLKTAADNDTENENGTEDDSSDSEDNTEDNSGAATSADFETITGLLSSTEYTLRVVYHGNETTLTEASVTTEEEAQVGNAAMEDWETETLSVKRKLSGITWETDTREWWRPYADDEQDPWWDVNSRVSMPSSCTPAYFEFKCFPCVGPSVETPDGSESSAHIIVIKVGDGQTDTVEDGTTYNGELFIGTADDDGAHESEGHAFPSRPSKIAFDYDFHSKDGETFLIEIDVYAEDGETLIGSYTGTDGGNTRDAAEESDAFEGYQWETYEGALDYPVTNLKAGKIYISFKASSASSPEVHGDRGREFAGTTTGVHSGASLRVDNIQLIYE